MSFNASQKLVCVRLHCLQRAGQSEVLRGLPRWYDDPKANCATVYNTYVAKHIDSPDVAASVDPD